MIIDKLANASIYYGIDEKITRALKWLQSTNLETFPEGEHQIEGKDIFVRVSNADTKPLDQSQVETHKEYIDIQFVYKGKEYIGFMPDEFAGKETKRNDADDVVFFDGKPDLVTVHEGYFMMVFPHDAHAPRVAIGSPAKTRKFVLKVKWH